MNKRIFKSIISLVLVVVMAVSTMMVSAVSASAETENENEYNYKITIKTGDMEQAGTSSRIDLFPYDYNGNRMKGITFYGDKMSAEFGQNGTYVCTYTCENEIDNIGAAISTSRIFDNWNLEYIETEYSDGTSTVTKRFQYNKWLVDSIAYRDPNPEKYCVFSENKTVSKYDFNFQTAGSLGTSLDKISIKVTGTYGSTSWHDVGKVANDKTDSGSFSDINVGAIKSITVKNNGSDGWYPEIIKITKGGNSTTIYGGRWVDDKKEVTLSVTDRVAKVNVKTNHMGLAATNANVYINLIDGKGNETEEINLSNIHPDLNAFEKSDRSTFYIKVPDNFEELVRIDARIDDLIFISWGLDFIDVTLDGKTKVFYYYKELFDGDELRPSGYVYKVTVKTGDKPYAGTDCRVDLYAYDENGKKIKKYCLDSQKNDFERNNTDVFYIASFKKVANIKMLCDDAITGTAWLLDYVQLDLINNDIAVESKKYTFNKWIIGDRKLHESKRQEDPSDFVEYKFDFQTASSDGTSSEYMYVKVNGDKGSTNWYDVGKVANEEKGSCSFSDINVGTIKSITVKNNGSDGWYPEIINITKGGTTTAIYGGRWVGNKEMVTFSVTDRAAKVTVKTGDVLNSGTDSGVSLRLVDDKGNSIDYVNLSDIHPKSNAFERYDRATFYVRIPKEFGEITQTDVHLNSGSDDWYLDYVDVTLDGVTKVFPCYAFVDDKIKTLNTTGYLYKATVKTSGVKLAGTDNDVYLHAYDENGNKIKEYFLDNDKNNFEKGDKEYFYIVSPQKINDIKMNISSDGGTDWHLEYVQLDLMDGDNAVESAKYNYSQWIEGGKKLYEPTSKEVLTVEQV